MIEKDILQYLQGISALTTKLGGVNKVVAIQAPSGLAMPWLIIEPSGGTRKRISANKLQEFNSVRVSVDCGAAQLAQGRAAMELARDALENLRGTLGDSKDIYIECGAISGYAGLYGAHRFSLTCDCKFTDDWVKKIVNE